MTQTTVGLGYEGYWRDRGEFSAGLQRTRYQKTVETPGGADAVRRDEPWLVSATAAAYLTPRLALYAGYNTGLEESGTAPENATNFPETLPAARTWQRDVGMRSLLPGGLRLVVGGFELHKPYFNFDPARRFVELGEVRNAGVEASLSGQLTPNLTMLLGLVASRPRVEARTSAARVGDRPVGLPEQVGRLNLNYVMPDHRTSFDVAISHVGERPGDTANLIGIPGYTTVDLGMRYRFKINAAPATLRILVANLTNEFGWRVFGGGVIQPIEPRRLSVSVAADF